MPTLSNPRHELFAQGIARGLSPSDAFVQAGFKANRGNASRLNANESVKQRVAEIQAETLSKSTERRIVTLDSVHAELDRAAAVAERTGNAKALHDIAMSRAKLAGLISEQSTVRLNVDIGGMRTRDLEQAILDRVFAGKVTREELAALAAPVIDVESS
jgi:hypothetical protein